MHIILNKEDLTQLSQEALAEIAALLDLHAGEFNKKANEASYPPQDKNGCYNISPSQARQLIAGVNDKSRRILSDLCKMGEREVWEYYMYKPTTFASFAAMRREFFGPVNRRLRSITGDRSADLFLITMSQDSNGVESEDFMCISDLTAFSLRVAFGLPEDSFLIFDDETQTDELDKLKHVATRVARQPEGPTPPLQLILALAAEGYDIACYPNPQPHQAFGEGSMEDVPDVVTRHLDTLRAQWRKEPKLERFAVMSRERSGTILARLRTGGSYHSEPAWTALDAEG